MSSTSNGIVLWSLGAAGTLLVYAAYKNIKPQAVLAHYFSGASYSASDNIQTLTNTSTGPYQNPGQLAAGGTKAAPNPNDSHLGIEPGSTNAADYNAQGQYIPDIPAVYAASPNTYIPGKAVTA